MIIFICGIATFAFLAIWVVKTYNKLVSERLKVHTQWSQIDVVLKQRTDLIPALVETVKGYAAYEREALAEVTEARSRYMGAGGADAKMQAAAQLSGALGRLMAVAEAYPDLKANQSFLDFQHQVGEIEKKLADFRQFYNDMVLRYNRQLVVIPSNLVAGLFHFREEAFFQVEQADQQKPTVAF